MTDVDQSKEKLDATVKAWREQVEETVGWMENQIHSMVLRGAMSGSDAATSTVAGGIESEAVTVQLGQRANQLKQLVQTGPSALQRESEPLQMSIQRIALLVTKLLKQDAISVEPLVPLLHVELTMLRKIQLQPTKPREIKHHLALIFFGCVLCFVVRHESDRVALAHAICNEIVRLSEQKSSQELVVWCLEDSVALCGQLFTKEEWLANQSNGRLVLQWMVSQVNFPHLGGDLLGRVLALVLPLVDDLKDSTQLVGAQMLCHIVKNVTPTELRWYEDVLIDVFGVGLTSNKSGTLDAMLECLGVGLEMLSPPGDLKHYDTFFLSLVNKTSVCSEIPLKLVFIRRLRPLIRQLGVPNTMHIVRYLQPLVRVLCETIENCLNGELIVETLETLRIVIQSAWIRAALHQERILVAVVRAVMACELLEVTSPSQSTAWPHQIAHIESKCSEICGLLHQLSLNAHEIDAFFTKIRANSPPQQLHLTAFCNKLLETDRLGRYDRHNGS